jgi:hypothetical protein
MLPIKEKIQYNQLPSPTDESTAQYQNAKHTLQNALSLN